MNRLSGVRPMAAAVAPIAVERLQRYLVRVFCIFAGLYILSLAMLAILRVFTGMSIKRFGYFSLRHISFTLKDGIEVEIGRAGITFHRPTIARPGWFSFYITNVDIKVNSKMLRPDRDTDQVESIHGSGTKKPDRDGTTLDDPVAEAKNVLEKLKKGLEEDHGNTPVEGLLQKENGDLVLMPPKVLPLKALKFFLRFTKLIELSATSIQISITDVVQAVFGSMSLTVDFHDRSGKRASSFIGTLDNSPLRPGELPIHAQLIVQACYLKNPGEDAREAVDFAMFEFKGVVDGTTFAMKDISFLIKIGRYSIYMMALLKTMQLMKARRTENARSQSVSDAQKFISKDELKYLAAMGKILVMIVKEVEIKISYLGIFGVPITTDDDRVSAIAATASDISVDVRRLNPQSPGFKLGFSKGDTAHQASIALMSVNLGLDSGKTQEELVFVPMVTLLAKTNFFSETLQYIGEENASYSKAMIKGNVNIESPTVDLTSEHIPVLLESLINYKKEATSPKPASNLPTKFSWNQFLPKAGIKITVDEPAARIQVVGKDNQNANCLDNAGKGDAPMIISSCSKLHCTLFGEHTTESDQVLNYKSTASLYMSLFEIWFRTPHGVRYDLITADSLHLSCVANIRDALMAKIVGDLDGVKVSFIKQEVFSKIRELHLPFRRWQSKRQPKFRPSAPDNRSISEKVPPWLEDIKLNVKEVLIEVAKEAEHEQKTTLRGMAFKIKSAFIGLDMGQKEKIAKMLIDSISAYKVMEPHLLEFTASTRFLNVPNLTASFEIGTENQLNVICKQFYFNYSLTLHYLALSAVSVLKQAVASDAVRHGEVEPARKKSSKSTPLKVFCKIDVARIKAALPNDAFMMIEFNKLHASTAPEMLPCIAAKALRIYSTHPVMTTSWVRVVVIRNLCVKFNLESEGDQVLLESDGIRFNIPHQFIVYKLLDNLVTCFKGALLLMVRHKTNVYDQVIKPTEKTEPPKIPRVRLKSGAINLTVEDDLFEARLAMIFHAGMREQIIRMEKLTAFEDKLEEIRKAQQQNGTKDNFNGEKSNGAAGGGSNSTSRRQRANVFRRHHRTNSANKDDTKHVDHMMYDSKVTVAEAREKLLENFSTSWIYAFRSEATRKMKMAKNVIQRYVPKADELDKDTLSHERIADYAHSFPLFWVAMKDCDFHFKLPDDYFMDVTDSGLRNSTKDWKQFLHNVGKGIPTDTRYNLLIPIWLDWKMSELTVRLRDYPIPLLHFSHLAAEQKTTKKAVHLQGVFCVAETYYDRLDNLRHINIPLVPNPESKAEMADIYRTVASTKMYSVLDFEVNSSDTAHFCWGNSLQPALQTVSLAFDSFSKPPIDQSPPLGFWDKIRSVFHSKMLFRFTEGDVMLHLKGSRSPYRLLNDGAGFVMNWKKNVRFAINPSASHKELIVVRSEEYTLGVPNYVAIARDYKVQIPNYQNIPFDKSVVKMTGSVEWKAGMLFERETISDGVRVRSQNFTPHYEVQLENPKYVENIEHYDAYKDFRSKYIHLAISVQSPVGKKWATDLEPSPHSYNTMHLTPGVFLHFKSWWDTFDGCMSLPIRTGPLFPPLRLKKPKLGRSIFTIKYSVLFSPLFVCHMYRHSVEEAGKSKQASTGLKAKIHSFSLDLHQRREYGNGVRWRMKLNQGELDCKVTDVRLVLAKFREPSAEELIRRKQALEESSMSSYSGIGSSSLPSSGKFKISDNDTRWIDMDDYDELEDFLPVRSFPKITVLPLLFTPRWTFFRQTDHSEDDIGTDEFGLKYVKFGNDQGVHDCLIGHNHPETTHHVLLSQRVTELEDTIKNNEASIETLERDLSMVTEMQDVKDKLKAVKERVDLLKAENECMRNKISVIIAAGAVRNRRRRTSAVPVHDLKNSILDSGPTCDATGGICPSYDSKIKSYENELDMMLSGSDHDLKKWKSANLGDSELSVLKAYATNRSKCSTDPLSRTGTRHSFFSSDDEDNSDGRRTSTVDADIIASPNSDSKFSNRFIVHDLLLKWNNANRNAMFRYFRSVSDRRAHMYFLTQDAIHYVQQLAKKQNNGKRRSYGGLSEPAELGRNDSNAPSSKDRLESFEQDLRSLIEDFAVQNSYLVRLISPQIQLVSNKNKNNSVLVTSQNVELRILTILDQKEDKVAGVVETRYGLLLEDAQFLTLDKSAESAELISTSLSSNSYGSDAKSTNWPPWLAIETCYDCSPIDDALVIKNTTVILRYDKPNPLRVAEESSEAENGVSFCNKVVRDEKYRINRISVDFPKVVAQCDSKQYFAIYTIVVDLLLYSEPGKKENDERLERLLLVADLSDLDNAVLRARTLQKNLRDLRILRNELYVRSVDYSRSNTHRTEGDILAVEIEIQQNSLELDMMMRAIKTGLEKENSTNSAQFLKWAISADQIIWHVLDKDRSPMIDIALAGSSLNRIEGKEGFNSNTIEIGMLQAFNLDPKAAYPELITPFLGKVKKLPHDDPNSKGLGATDFSFDHKVIVVRWVMLDPIGGIPIMENFEVDIQPVKIQLERETGEKIMEYVFPDNKVSPFVVPADIKTIEGEESDNDSFNSSDDSDGFETFVAEDSTEVSSNRSLYVGNTTNKYTPSILSSSSSMNGQSRNGIHRISESSNGKKNQGAFYSSFMSSASRHSHSNDSKSLVAKRKSSSSKLQDSENITGIETMVERAAAYMSIVDISIKPTTLCISYKGSNHRNLTDIHEFVLNIPGYEYKNKMWSNMDLAMHLKKDVIKTLLQHTGALISNKITKRRATHGYNPPLRQLSDYSSFTPLNNLSVGSQTRQKSVDMSSRLTAVVSKSLQKSANGSKNGDSAENTEQESHVPAPRIVVTDSSPRPSEDVSVISDRLSAITPPDDSSNNSSVSSPQRTLEKKGKKFFKKLFN